MVVVMYAADAARFVRAATIFKTKQLFYGRSHQQFYRSTRIHSSPWKRGFGLRYRVGHAGWYSFSLFHIYLLLSVMLLCVIFSISWFLRNPRIDKGCVTLYLSPQGQVRGGAAGRLREQTNHLLITEQPPKDICNQGDLPPNRQRKGKV